MPPAQISSDSPRTALWHPCFSTLGCPEFTLRQAIDLGRENGIDRLEIRSLENQMDLPALLAGKPGGWKAVHALLESEGVKVAMLGSSFRLVGHRPEDWLALFDFALLAEALHVPYLRVFGGGEWGEPLADGVFDAAAATVRRWREERDVQGWKVDLAIETHDAFSASLPFQKLQDRLEHPVAVLWDSHHTWRLGGESPAESWRTLEPWVCHVHIKDSVAEASAGHAYTYVLPGRGEMPVGEVLSLLDQSSFTGAVSLEWEKKWHPSLAPLKEALPACREAGWW